MLNEEPRELHLSCCMKDLCQAVRFLREYKDKCNLTVEKQYTVQAYKQVDRENNLVVELSQNEISVVMKYLSRVSLIKNEND